MTSWPAGGCGPKLATMKLVAQIAAGIVVAMFAIICLGALVPDNHPDPARPIIYNGVPTTDLAAASVAPGNYVAIGCTPNSCDMSNPAPGDDGEIKVFTSLHECVAFLPSLGKSPLQGKMEGDRFFLTTYGAGTYFECVRQPTS
jgi:hypothetical protein